eukprot:TRINITY_DN8099_c0_g1_i4.p1 TRINITY_DN8099_c0_g1~~TRINITY_DN8099_c0_g1_i4.p1  ORF type:complete len:573 (+),score=31.66 TRINITY_DN8099_c0_g1_i4:175-1719(+)
MQVESGKTATSKNSALGRRKRPLQVLFVVALVFYNVSGGPFGSEDAVSSGGGPLLAILGFILLPFIWSIPESLVTAELGTTFPENSGYVQWVAAAFGPFWGFQEGFYSWVSGVTDNAIYPVMFLTTLEVAMPFLKQPAVRVICTIGLNLVWTYLNWRGLVIVGMTAFILMVTVLLPFVIFILLSVPHIQPSHWLQYYPEKVDFLQYLNVMFWNLNYWDSIGTVAGEIENPQRTLPRSLAFALLIVVCTYLLPLMAATGVNSAVGDWKLGYYATIAQQVGGNPLCWFIVISAAASNMGQFEAEMSADSYQVLGMSERGYLPRFLNTRSKYGTPTYGIILSSLGVLVISSFEFWTIVDMLNYMYCLAEMLEFVSFLYLRFKHPELQRPFRVPLPNWGCVLMLVPPMTLISYMLFMPFVQKSYTLLGVVLIFIVIGLVLYPLLMYSKRKGWLQFEDNLDSLIMKDLYEGYEQSPEEDIIIPEAETSINIEQASLLRRGGGNTNSDSISGSSNTKDLN